jgi:hypothetical protein
MPEEVLLLKHNYIQIDECKGLVRLMQRTEFAHRLPTIATPEA